MNILACRTYHGKRVGQTLLRMPDGKSAFKVYYISVVGRDTPERFEWERAPRTPQDFEPAFLAGGHQGIGFVLAFPHVTKLFRFSPGAETILDVRAFHTDGMRPMDLAREEGFVEFACYAEAVIAAEEYHAWARAASVEAYLASRAVAADFPVERHAKLAAYWQAA
ncbi:MAG: hypothetical protein WC713_09235, partial [Candidatus Methylomirabilota bacterium]